MTDSNDYMDDFEPDQDQFDEDNQGEMDLS